MPLAVIRPRYRDPFASVLVASPAVVLSDEQCVYIRAVLDVSSSDSKFAQKAYDAIIKILTGGSVVVPTVTSLTPNSAEIGDPSFTLHVHGTNFKNTDKIIFAGVEEPTTFVSATELTTGVNMSTWFGPDVLPVMVQTVDGVTTTPMNFTFVDNTPATTVTTTKETPFGVKKEDHPNPPPLATEKKK